MSFRIPIERVEPDFRGLIKSQLNEIEDPSTLTAAKIHLQITVDSKKFYFDQVFNSEEMSLKNIRKEIKLAIRKISLQVDGSFADKIDFDSHIFLKNNQRQFHFFSVHYLLTTTGECTESNRTLPMNNQELLEYIAIRNSAYKRKNYPILDDEHNFILEKPGVQGPYETKSRFFCTLI